jgi:hypothetical protein
MYKDVAKDLEKFIIKYPDTVVPTPTSSDYLTGYMDRYFARKATEEAGHIFEIDKDTYSEYLQNPFWKVAEIRWRISGPKDPIYNDDGTIRDKGVIVGNRAKISSVSSVLKNLSLYLPNPLQFYKG